MSNVWKFRNFAKIKKIENQFARKRFTTLTHSHITTPIANTSYLFINPIIIHFWTFDTLQHVIWSNISQFMDNLFTNSHFTWDYTTGLPDAYIGWGTARPYSKMLQNKISGINFYFAFSDSQTQVESWKSKQNTIWL